MTKPHVHAELIKAWADGAQIEWLTFDGRWVILDSPDWHPLEKFRVALTKPYVDISHVAPSFHYLAADLCSDGSILYYLYTEKPRWAEETADERGRWIARGGRHFKADVIASFKPGTCHPRDSLVKIR